MIQSSKIISILCLAAYFGITTPLHAQTAPLTVKPIIRDKVALFKHSNPFLSVYIKQSKNRLVPLKLGSTTVNNDARVIPGKIDAGLIRINNDANMLRLNISLQSPNPTII
ncbi:MAG: hypothetical protein HQL68_02290 [Magnetococcales bacterium]|nr:hypothetical protein [Magnetococcales bacterium]